MIVHEAQGDRLGSADGLVNVANGDLIDGSTDSPSTAGTLRRRDVSAIAQSCERAANDHRMGPEQTCDRLRGGRAFMQTDVK